jgi:hypothetical protein
MLGNFFVVDEFVSIFRSLKMTKKVFEHEGLILTGGQLIEFHLTFSLDRIF